MLLFQAAQSTAWERAGRFRAVGEAATLHSVKNERASWDTCREKDSARSEQPP